MLKHTRRRTLGLMIAVLAGTRSLSKPVRARAQEQEEDSKPDCFDTKEFGLWTGQASDVSAGAINNEVSAANKNTCGLLLSMEVDTEFNARIFVEGSPEGTRLPESVLRDAKSRFSARDGAGKTVVETPLCGNCKDMVEDAFGLVLPLATAPLLRDEDKMDIVLRLAGHADDCVFTVDCTSMRQALDWAEERKTELQSERDEKQCASVEGCFITTACCGAVGLEDGCFELRTLRRYRDSILAGTPEGRAEITRYYALAPRLLARLRRQSPEPDAILLQLYARYVLPAALAARLGLNRLAYRLYRRMLGALARTARL